MSYLTYSNHRGGLQTICPHCETEFTNSTWYKNKIEIIHNGKRGNMDFYSLLSKCPKCSEHSWAHWHKDFLDLYKEDKEEIL